MKRRPRLRPPADHIKEERTWHVIMWYEDEKGAILVYEDLLVMRPGATEIDARRLGIIRYWEYFYQETLGPTIRRPGVIRRMAEAFGNTPPPLTHVFVQPVSADVLRRATQD